MARMSTPASPDRHTETPLHWAASCDDVDVMEVLLDHGADIEAEGACIGGGTPLADAVAFGQWRAARRLIERGAEAQSLAVGCPGSAGPRRTVLHRWRPAGARRSHERVLVCLSRRTAHHGGVPARPRG